MKKIALLFGLLFAFPAFAADDTVIVTPGVGVGMKSKDVGAGKQAMQPILSDASGNTLLTTAGADAVSNTLTGIPVYSRMLVYNSTTWDRWTGLVTLAAETTKVIGTVRVASGGVASGSFASGSIASGAVASGAVASGAYASGSIASGAMVDLGAQADSVCGTSTGTCTLVALIKYLNTQAATIVTNTGAAIPAGTAIIGKVGIDQTTPGTTNLVAAGQNGTWTVQPGNTANTTPWLVTQSGQYPSGATPITASATGTTAATTATLAASASIKTYICGFSIRANATAAATANSTVTGTITGTLNYTQWTAPLASGLGITEQIFAPCIPSSAINTAIAVISAAPGTGGVVSVTAWGYQL